MLVQSLKSQTTLPVEAAVNGLVLKSNMIYITPAGKQILIKKGRIRLSKPAVNEKPIPDMDQLFNSIAGEAKARGIGIVFSTNCTDGTAGLKAIENAGGLTLVQEHRTPPHNGSLLSSSTTLGIDPAFQANNLSNAIKNFILEQQGQVYDKKALKAPQSKKEKKIRDIVKSILKSPKQTM